MCGRFNLRTNLSQLAMTFLAEPSPGMTIVPRFNIAPTQQIVSVVAGPSSRKLTTFRWGLVPSWAKDIKIGFSGINARAETIATKPAFRAAFKKRRCLILTNGYYEWLTEGKAKQPYLYELDHAKPFAFAGLWEQWWGADHEAKEPLETCTIITTAANALASKVHDRMPVILPEERYDEWLDPTNQNAEQLESLLVSYPAEQMTMRPVSTQVNNVRNEGPECIGITNSA